MKHDLSKIDKKKSISQVDFLNNYAIPNKPLLLTGIMNDSIILKKWTKDFFIKHYGDWLFILSSNLGTGADTDRHIKLVDFFKYIEEPDDNNNFYLGGWQFELHAPELLNDIETPDIFKCWTSLLEKEKQKKYRWIFVGPAGSSIPLHIDFHNTSAWHLVIKGRKIWNFYPPEQNKYLYNGEVDTFNPDYVKYPLFREAKAITCIQNEGEVVFNPSGWYHQVYNDLPGFSFTENFINSTNYLNVFDSLVKNNSEDWLQLLDELTKLKKMATF